ncbi:MAG: MFS transporter [Fervidicoccaceae archaeon]
MLNRKGGGNLAKVGMKLTPALLIYVSIVLMRAANASFIVSLVAAFPSISAYMQGIIQASYSLTEAIFGIFAGIIYEYLGSFRSILLSSSLLFASYAAMVVFSSIEVGPQAFAIPSALAGLSASFLLTSSLAVISEETSKASAKGRLFGVGGLEASNIIGYAVGFTFAGTIQLLFPSAAKNFSPSFFFSFLALSSSALLSLSVRGEMRERRRVSLHVRTRVERRVLKLVPMWLGFSIVMGVAFVSPKFLNVLLSSMGGITYSFHVNSGFMLLFALLILSAGVMGGSYIAGVIGKMNSLFIGSLSLSALLVTLSLFLKSHPLSGGEQVLYAAGISILGVLALSVPPTLLSLLADYTDASRIRGPSSGVYVTSMGIGIALGESMGGKIYDSFGLPFLLASLALIFFPLSMGTWLMLRSEGRGRNLRS